MQENYTQKPTFSTPFPLSTPVLFLTFNRPETTQQVFSEIRQAQPPRLYVAADGPRSENSSEVMSCELVRSVATNVDWDCEVKTLFRDQNLGCRLAVSQAIDWFFDQEPEGIILEDDCLPDQSFFWFCQELLERYRDDTRIMHIGGTNFQFGKARTNHSYYFSRYAHVWGWASWRRAWKFYDVEMKNWKDAQTSGLLESLSSDRYFLRYWRQQFELTMMNKIDTWDHQWTFACWSQNAMSVVPETNLVSNIGFGEIGTNTKQNSQVAALPVQEINFPLRHNSKMTRSIEADTYTEIGQYFKSFWLRVLHKIIRFLKLNKKFH